MKIIATLALLATATVSYSQTTIEKTFPVQSARELVLEFDHPNVNIQTWEKNEVLVKGTVSINNGENDKAFELQTSNVDGVLKINSFLKDKESLPRHIVIKKGDKEYYFKARDFSDPEVQKFLEDNGREYSYMSNGLVINVDLQIFVPKNLRTTIDAKFGLVEFKQFDAPLKINAKHGKVDATISANVGELTARTQHGEIMSNLDIKFDQQPFDRTRRSNSWTELVAHLGKGPSYFIETKHGTVYLRKP